MNLLVVFIVLATVSLVDHAKGQQDVRKKIMVDVYYESLCPGRIFNCLRIQRF